jgi:hypothetical protein
MGEAGRRTPEERSFDAAVNRLDVPEMTRSLGLMRGAGVATPVHVVTAIDALARAEVVDLQSRWSARLLARLVLATPGSTMETVDELRELLDQLPDDAVRRRLDDHARTAFRATRRARATSRPRDIW